MTDLISRLRGITPARLLLGRHGAALPTAALLKLRADHAAAKDAVAAEVDFAAEPWAGLAQRFNAVTATTRAASKGDYLRRPDLGRKLSPESARALETAVGVDQDMVIAIGDGLSATAAERQVPALLPLLLDSAKARGWTVARPILIARARVGVMNDLGALLRPKVVVLLIGERPGLTTAESLSAYLAWQPKAADTDANRNVISNIHADGVGPEEAARRIIAWATVFKTLGLSGAAVKEPDSPLLTV